jgi:hypothetical protein
MTGSSDSSYVRREEFCVLDKIANANHSVRTNGRACVCTGRSRASFTGRPLCSIFQQARERSVQRAFDGTHTLHVERHLTPSTAVEAMFLAAEARGGL